MADLTMVRRELLIGYTVAGFLAVLVPVGAWHAVFLQGHGVWTTIENAVVAPLVAVISFVCSIGNVPLAAALWKGGISFGGVISFLFADLIAFPLLLVYRRYYGTRMALRMLVGFWAVMSVGRTGHRGDLPGRRDRSHRSTDPGGPRSLRLGLHHLPQPGRGVPLCRSLLHVPKP